MTKKEYIITHYPDLTNQEIILEIGVSNRYINSVRRECGLNHSEETEVRQKKQRSQRVREGMVRSIAYDKMLMLSGMKPRSKRHFATIPKSTSGARRLLIKKWNYFADEECMMTLYYDSKTRRNPKEDYFKNKYHFQFIEADED